jgi:hypothetical protein
MENGIPADGATMKIFFFIGPVTLGGLDDAGEGCALIEIKITYPFAEILLAGGFDTPGAAPETNLVKVKFEYLVFCIAGFELYGGKGLPYLPFHRGPGGQIEVSCKLLGKGRSALRIASSDDVDKCRLYESPDIHTPVVVEFAIFNRYYRMLKVCRDLIERNEASAFNAELMHYPAVLIEDPRGKRLLNILQLRNGGQILG